MNPNNYLKTILAQQTLAEDGPERKELDERKARVEKLILEEFKNSNPTIKFAGSVAKGTPIKDSYDLDVCCYFSYDDTDCGETLKDIYHKVKECLEKNYYVMTKPVALRLQDKSPDNLGIDFHIDVVPGRFVDESKGDCYLHISVGEKSYFKTNLKKHLTFIKTSGLIDQIKLMKIWKVRAGLQIRTFILELLTIKILKDSESITFEEYVKEFLTKVRDNISNIGIEDPANPNGNDLSEIFDDSIKSELKEAADRSLKSIENDDWERVFGPLQDQKETMSAPAILSAASRYENPPKPYADDVV